MADDGEPRTPLVEPNDEREAMDLATRGPKRDPNAPHNKKIREVGQQIVDEGGEILEGGGVLPEKLTPTVGGFKKGRRLDIKYKDKDGVERGVLVGLEESDPEKDDGTMRPILREREARSDLNDRAKIPTVFVPYGAKGSNINKGFK